PRGTPVASPIGAPGLLRPSHGHLLLQSRLPVRGAAWQDVRCSVCDQVQYFSATYLEQHPPRAPYVCRTCRQQGLELRCRRCGGKKQVRRCDLHNYTTARPTSTPLRYSYLCRSCARREYGRRLAQATLAEQGVTPQDPPEVQRAAYRAHFARISPKGARPQEALQAAH